MSGGARFPVPGGYEGDPPAAEGLRQALALATDAELRMVTAMLVTGAKLTAGVAPGEPVTVPLEGTAAVFGWLSALVQDESGRRAALFGELAGDGEA